MVWLIICKFLFVHLIKGKENQFEQKEIYNNNSKKLPNGATIDKYIFGERRLVQDSGLSFGW